MNTLETVALAITATVRHGLVGLFHDRIAARAVGDFTWADLVTAGILALLFLGLHAAAAAVLRRKKRSARAAPDAHSSRLAAFEAIDRPIYVLIWVIAFYVVIAPLILKLPPDQTSNAARSALTKLSNIGVFIVLLWMCLRLTRVIDCALEHWAARTQSVWDRLLVPILGRGLRAFLPVASVLLALPMLGLPPSYHDVIARISSLAIIGAITWFLFRSIGTGRDLLLRQFNITAADNLRARTVHTQVRVITKTLYVGVGVIAFACALMEFKEVRHVGASLLASAGVLGIVGGLAAQSTLANLFAGFQLALAQPIRLDDVVVVEGAWGRIEEITLTYVVIHVWDDTRLVAPLKYFISNPFQNWTRVSANILGQIHFWADYTLPVDELRPAVERIVKACPLWDGRFWNLQVVEASDHAMQLRVLATASDSSRAWDLRCKVREDILGHIQRTYPGSLPRARTELGRLPRAPLLAKDQSPAPTESARLSSDQPEGKHWQGKPAG